MSTFSTRLIVATISATALAYVIGRVSRRSSTQANSSSGSSANGPRCYALVFVKPHGHPADVTQGGRIVPFLENHLREAGITIESKGLATGDSIARLGTIDQHYSAIANYALRTAPSDLPVTDKTKSEFKEKYGVTWSEAVAKGQILGCQAAMTRLGQSEEDFLKTVDAARPNGMKLAPGCYISKLMHGSEPVYVVNGFYAGMRAEYVKPTTRVTWYVVSWPEARLSWKAFRADVLGATDPTRANHLSVRRQILIKAPELGLTFVPSTGNNCVHGSASGLEGLNERRIWTSQRDLRSDPFGRWLLDECKFSSNDVEWFLSNPSIDGKPLFDVVEDASYADTQSRLREALQKKR